MKISLRQFQRNFHQLRKLQQVYEVIEQDGTLCGTFLPPDGRASVSPKTALAELQDIGDGRLAEPPTVVPAQAVCAKCGHPASYQGETYDETGDWVNMKICATCYKKHKPSKFRLISDL